MKQAITYAASAILALGLFLPAQAQDAPSYAHPSYASDEEAVRGRIAAVNGAYALSIHDDRGFLDAVSLHKGTIINPTGLRLAPGMRVVVLGHNTGSSFAANEIDTPYAYAHRGAGVRTTVIVAPRFGW